MKRIQSAETRRTSLHTIWYVFCQRTNERFNRAWWRNWSSWEILRGDAYRIVWISSFKSSVTFHSAMQIPEMCTNMSSKNYCGVFNKNKINGFVTIRNTLWPLQSCMREWPSDCCQYFLCVYPFEISMTRWNNIFHCITQK